MQTLTLIMAMVAVCGQTGRSDGPSVESVALAVRQLGHREFEVRQQATAFLWATGKSITPALEKATESLDPEIRLRATSILERFRHGIFVDTPQREVKLINQFRYGDEREQRRAYRQLAKGGNTETLLALLELVTRRTQRTEIQKLLLDRLETDQNVDRIVALAERWRSEGPTEVLEQRIRTSLGRQVPRLLADGREELAESILKDAAISNEGMRNWAIYLLLQGRLADVLKDVDPSSVADQSQLRRLVYMWRAAGDLEKARLVAERLEPSSQDLLRGVLFESRDWVRLAKVMEQRFTKNRSPTARNVEEFGYAAAAFRMSGDKKRFDQQIDHLEALAQTRVAMDKHCAEALLINHEIERAIAIYRRRLKAAAFEVLCIQDRYDDAFQFAGIADPHAAEDNMPWFEVIAAKSGGNVASTNQRFDLAVVVARVLHQLGEKDQAIRAFDILARSVQYQRGNSQLESIVQAELRVGLWHRACNHAAMMLAKGKYPDPFTSLFPRHSDISRFWWEYLTDVESMGSTEALLKIGEMLRVDPANLESSDETLAYVAAAKATIGPMDPDARVTRLLALAETYGLHSRSDLALPLLEEAAETSAIAALRLGDSAAEKADWVAAEKWYLSARDLDPRSSLARYLHGHALVQLGRPNSGEPEIRLAQLLPLANSDSRRRLAAGLKNRGLIDAAVEQWELIRRTSDMLVSLSGGFRDTGLIDATQNIGNLIKDEPLRRTEYWEMMHLSCLEVLLFIRNHRGYFHTPFVLHKTRAQAFLDQGDIDLALEEIRVSQSFMPGNIELAEHLVPRLESHGRSDAADELFEQSYDFVENICRQFPDSPLHHNNLAWLSARCGRRLDAALVHVQRALELVPDSPSYLDTLGEVHFRRGEFELAVRCAERCLELDPDNRFFHEQLSRFQDARGETDG